MSTLDKLRPNLAFAGVGWIGRARLQAAVANDLAQILMISDPSAACVAEALRITPDSRTVTFDDVLADRQVTGVVIATPNALHKQQAIAAVESGKAVFCQKPLGRNLGEVEEVVRAAARHNRLLGADFSYRYTTAFQAIHSVMKSGELGKIFAVDLKFHNAYGPDKSWFYDLSQSGGGCLLDLGIHLVDLLLYALDFPQAVSVTGKLLAKGVSVKGKGQVEDYAAACVELENDVTAQLACSWNLAAGCEAVIEASFFGTKGSVALKNVAGSFYDFEGLRFWGTKTEVLATPPDDWGGKALLHWIEKLAETPSFDEEAFQYTRSAELVDKIYGRIS